MDIESIKYINTIKSNVKIRCIITFNRSTTNWATNEPIKYGYRVSVIPVTILGEGKSKIEKFDSYSGFNDNLFECDRRSKARLLKAIDNLDLNIPQYKNFFRARGFQFKDEIK